MTDTDMTETNTCDEGTCTCPKLTEEEARQEWQTVQDKTLAMLADMEAGPDALDLDALAGLPHQQLTGLAMVMSSLVLVAMPRGCSAVEFAKAHFAHMAQMEAQMAKASAELGDLINTLQGQGVPE